MQKNFLSIYFLKKVKRLTKAPFTIYDDFDNIDNIDFGLKKYQDHIVCSYGYKLTLIWVCKITPCWFSLNNSEKVKAATLAFCSIN